MKILHTADWHVGKRLEHIERLGEQKKVFEEICQIANNNNVDIVVIAGDLFDNFNPSAEAETVFYHYLRVLSNNGNRPVIAIAGNHDSAERISAPNPLALAGGIFMFGNPLQTIPTLTLESGIKITKSDEGFIELLLPGYDYPIRIIASAFASAARLKEYFGTENEPLELRNHLTKKWKAVADKYCDDNGVNLLVSHFFMLPEGKNREEAEYDDTDHNEKEVGGLHEFYPSMIPQEIQYTALGHIHKPMVFKHKTNTIAYSGSPLGYSFNEANQNKYVNLVTLKPGEECYLEKIELTTKTDVVRIKTDNLNEALVLLEEHKNAIVELTYKVKNYISTEDKKAIEQAHDNLILKPEITFDESKYTAKKIDVTQSVGNLFAEYYKSRFGEKPDDYHIDIFNEITNPDEE